MDQNLVFMIKVSLWALGTEPLAHGGTIFECLENFSKGVLQNYSNLRCYHHKRNSNKFKQQPTLIFRNNRFDIYDDDRRFHNVQHGYQMGWNTWSICWIWETVKILVVWIPDRIKALRNPRLNHSRQSSQGSVDLSTRQSQWRHITFW